MLYKLVISLSQKRGYISCIVMTTWLCEKDPL